MKYYWRVVKFERDVTKTKYRLNANTADVKKGSTIYTLSAGVFTPTPGDDEEKWVAISNSGQICSFRKEVLNSFGGITTYIWYITVLGDVGDYGGTDYTAHVVAPIFIEDKIDETLDTGEVILKNMPISTKNAFPPKTKFRIERYTNPELTGDADKRWDMVVEHDDVEEYAGCPEICTHRISLIEASVIAQGMHVDNIALTYELKDVTLAYKTVADSSIKASVSVRGEGYGSDPLYINEDIAYAFNRDHYNSKSTFRTTFNYQWDNLDSIRNLVKFVPPASATQLTVSIPKLYAQTGDTGYDLTTHQTYHRWLDVCELPTKTTVTRTRKKRYVEMSNGLPVIDAGGNWIPKGIATTVSTETLTTAYSGPSSFDSSKCNRTGRTQLNYNGTEVNYTKILTGPPYPIGPNMWDGGLTRVDEKPLHDYFLENASTFTGRVLSRKVTNPASSVTFTTVQIAEGDQKGNDANGYYIQYDEYTVKTMADYPANTDLPLVVDYDGYIRFNTTGNTNGFPYKLYIDTGSYYRIKTPSSLSVEATLFVQDTSTIQNSTKFLTKPYPYNCYKMLRKALLTYETRLLEKGLDTIEYPIYIERDLKDKLTYTQMHETIFEQKNLWEVFIQIGYYIHAIPYLEFADDGTDRFILKYRALGSKEVKPDTSVKKTVFNSQNISEYFSQFDSYTTNLFSPQNVVEEWIVAKTSDPTYLVKNDTAELQTKYNILEIAEFKVRKNTSGEAADILNRIFEKSVYSVLTSATGVFPSKAAALYYELGSNKISGLTYTPPSVHGDANYALAAILSSVFGEKRSDIRFNNYTFYIKYRTQDSARVNQFRPDLASFLKNASMEQYPHHEQFYGQQEKIVDSERLSANLFGQLVRVGNTEYQTQEYVAAGKEKEAGQLFEINGEPYYVAAVENEYYQDAILQKVTYSKNYNQLSKIVTIPSEPRFYEVSERSTVRREVRLVDFVQLSTTREVNKSYTFLNSSGITLLKKIMFGTGTSNYPNYAYTVFKSDEKRQHLDIHQEDIPDNQLFPSTVIARDANNYNIIHPVESSDRSECIVPLLHFPMRDSIVFEWDMDDNYKAGDCVAATDEDGVNIDNGDYMAVQGMRYCDIMGRADLLGFKLFYTRDVERAEARRFPRADGYNVDAKTQYATTPIDKYVGLDKDNREALSFNYQIALLHGDASFVTFPNLFGNKSDKLKVCLLKETVSMFDETVNFNNAIHFANYVVVSGENPIQITFNVSSEVDMDKVRAVVLYEEDNGNMYPYIARNVDKLDNSHKLDAWYLYPAFGKN